MAVVEITGTEINEKSIVLTAVNIEQVLTAEDLFEEFELEECEFVFPRDGGALKYLYKVLRNNKKSRAGKSFGEMVQRLNGEIISLSESFLKKD